MNYVKDPELCVACQGIVDSHDFQTAVNLESRWDGRHTLPQAALRALEVDIEAYDGRDRGDPTHYSFKLWGELLRSRYHCAMCRLILMWDRRSELRHSPNEELKFFVNLSVTAQGGRRPGRIFDKGLSTIENFTPTVNVTLGEPDWLGKLSTYYTLAVISISTTEPQQYEDFEALLATPPKIIRRATLNQVHRWTHECTSHGTHEQCQCAENTVDASIPLAELPQRLLEIGEGPKVTVVQVDGLPAGIQYATLSHCWGNAKEACLWRQTPVSQNGKVDLLAAPRLLRDTVDFVQALGIRYLWVDALCIDQESEADWLQESAKMGDIYLNGYLNVSAITARSGYDSLFGDEDDETKIVLPARHAFADGRVLLSIRSKWIWQHHIRTSRLSKRGWVLQERLLSPRTIHIGAREIFWECRSLKAGEVSGRVLGFERDPKVDFANAGLLHGGRSVGGREEYSHAAKSIPFYQIWRDLIEHYSSTDLTKHSDKLVAIAGIAKRFANSSHLVPTSYMFGLWKGDLATGLLWTVSVGRFKVSYRAPSWSWARWEGLISFSMTNFTEERREHLTLRHEYLPADGTNENDPFLMCQNQVLRVQGMLAAFTLDNKITVVMRDRESSWNDTTTSTQWLLHWDDIGDYWSMRNGRQYYSLYLTSARVLKDLICWGLVILPTEREKGRFERKEVFKHVVYTPEAMEVAHALAKDPSEIRDYLYLSLDPELGFEIELV